MPSWKALAPVLILWGEADAFVGRKMAQESRRHEELKKLAAQKRLFN
jgi:hypothetical protein